MTRAIPTFAVAAFALLLKAAPAPAAPYAVSTGVKGVVDMYDLSSVLRTDRGFTIRYVAVSDHFPTFFGPTAYRVGREDYDCATGHYVIAVLQEFDHDGRLLRSLGREEPEHDMVVVPNTASADIYDRFCAESERGVSVSGTSPTETVERDSPLAAYRYGKALLTSAKQ